MPAKFIAFAQIYLDSEDYISAITEADDIKIAIERDLLDADLDESVDIIEVVDIAEKPSPVNELMNLRRARNVLIRHRSKDSYEMARSLDEIIHARSKLLEPEQARGSYDYSNMMQVLKEVIDGGNPLDH